MAKTLYVAETSGRAALLNPVLACITPKDLITMFLEICCFGMAKPNTLNHPDDAELLLFSVVSEQEAMLRLSKAAIRILSTSSKAAFRFSVMK